MVYLLNINNLNVLNIYNLKNQFTRKPTSVTGIYRRQIASKKYIAFKIIFFFHNICEFNKEGRT